MRRVTSTIFLLIGGWLLTAEPMMAFMDLGPDVRGVRPFVILTCLIIAAVPLLIGTWVSPGSRRRELGLTILIAMGAALVCGVSATALFADPGFKPFMPLLPPMPKIGVAPLVGVTNLAVMTAIGWWLFRAGSARKANDPLTGR